MSMSWTVSTPISIAPCSHDDAAKVWNHLIKCGDCRVALEEVKRQRRVVAFEGPHIGARSRGGTFFRVFFIALAAVGVSLAAAHAYVGSLKPTPHDLSVLGQTEWLAGSEAAIRLRLAKHPEGMPISGVPVTVELTGRTPDQRVQLASLTTGDHGAAVPRFRAARLARRRVQLQITASPPGRTPETITRTIALKHSWRLMVSTDKPVYQPGQVIRMRGLALRRPDLKPVAGQAIGLLRHRPAAATSSSATRGATSRFGIGSADCPLAGELIEGTYQVECRVGDTDEPGDGRGEDVRPAAVQGRASSSTGRTTSRASVVKGRVQADYVFGKPVGRRRGDASRSRRPTVAPRVLQSLDAPHRCRRDGRVRVPAARDARRPRAGLAVTRRSPSRRRSATRPARPRRGPRSRVVAAQPIRIEVIPEAGTLVQGLPNTIHLLTSHARRPARPDAADAISGLDHELRTSEPGRRPRSRSPRRQTRDELDRPGQATTRAAPAAARSTLTCGELAGRLPRPHRQGGLRGGEPVHVLVLGGGVEPVFLDLIKDGQTVLSESIEIDQGPRRAGRSTCRPSCSARSSCCAYRYGPAGLPVRKSRVVHDPPGQRL